VVVAATIFLARMGAHGAERTGYKPRNFEYAVKPRELMNAAVRDVENARRMFDLMPSGASVLWNSIIAYYAHDAEFQEALTLFDRMFQGHQQGGTRPFCQDVLYHERWSRLQTKEIIIKQ
jgi:pentatricopeptide repeat protein